MRTAAFALAAAVVLVASPTLAKDDASSSAEPKAVVIASQFDGAAQLTPSHAFVRSNFDDSSTAARALVSSFDGTPCETTLRYFATSF